MYIYPKKVESENRFLAFFINTHDNLEKKLWSIKVNCNMKTLNQDIVSKIKSFIDFKFEKGKQHGSFEFISMLELNEGFIKNDSIKFQTFR